MKWYVGVDRRYRKVAFKCSYEPTNVTHGAKYRYITGPFKTRRGAEYFESLIYHTDSSIDSLEHQAACASYYKPMKRTYGQVLLKFREGRRNVH